MLTAGNGRFKMTSIAMVELSRCKIARLFSFRGAAFERVWESAPQARNFYILRVVMKM
jgi:hypothetical protein